MTVKLTENRLLRGHPAVADAGSVGAHHIERHGDGDEEAADERGNASGDRQGLVAPRRPSLDVGVAPDSINSQVLPTAPIWARLFQPL